MFYAIKTVSDENQLYFFTFIYINEVFEIRNVPSMNMRKCEFVSHELPDMTVLPRRKQCIIRRPSFAVIAYVHLSCSYLDI